jgi:sterol desaturase/sphingolipid hydroxylase (fatty acid hydroxylase superfamily)
MSELHIFGFQVEPKAFLTGLCLAGLWIAEGFAPFYAEFTKGLRERLRHDARNLFIGLCNTLLLALLFGGGLVLVEQWGQNHRLGLLRLLPWPNAIELPLAILLFDLWMYLWHRANHTIPFLWRFHRMHHSDPQMDASTALRFHPGEIILSSIIRMMVLPLLGMTLGQIAIYEAILLPVILFHHSNVRLPRWFDYGILVLIVTPAMHRVHHSRWRPETDSNYGAISPWWDWLLGTFRLRADAHEIELGLEEYDDAEWQQFRGLLRTPLRNVHRSVKDTPARDED